MAVDASDTNGTERHGGAWRRHAAAAASFLNIPAQPAAQTGAARRCATSRSETCRAPSSARLSSALHDNTALPRPQNKYQAADTLTGTGLAWEHCALPGPALPDPARHYPALPGPAQPCPALPIPARSARPCPARPCPPCPALPSPARTVPARPARPCPAQPGPHTGGIAGLLSLMEDRSGGKVKNSKVSRPSQCRCDTSVSRRAAHLRRAYA